jgi:hypothetical protein
MASPENTLTIRNLACALNSDHEGNPWMASGQDGRFLRLNRNDRVLGAVGNGMGIGKCQSIKASYWAFDKHDSLYAGDSYPSEERIMFRRWVLVLHWSYE